MLFFEQEYGPAKLSLVFPSRWSIFPFNLLLLDGEEFNPDYSKNSFPFKRKLLDSPAGIVITPPEISPMIVTPQ